MRDEERDERRTYERNYDEWHSSIVKTEDKLMRFHRMDTKE